MKTHKIDTSNVPVSSEKFDRQHLPPVMAWDEIKRIAYSHGGSIEGETSLLPNGVHVEIDADFSIKKPYFPSERWGGRH